MIRCYLLLLAFLLSTQLFPQRVTSKTYELMLKSLLSHSVPEVSVPNVDLTDAILLDSREIVEYNVSKIEGARWVGYDDFTMDRVDDLDKESKVIVYCSVGYRSEKISEQLISFGFEDVSNLYGGIFEWKNQGNEVVDSNGVVVDQVHAYNKLWGMWLNRGEKVHE
ncbi:MAG: rhodanese-like domain-containing protein [Cytophagales bacterium]|nr:rhodanese-like domain-containing protein [Cytophagales bacterium]